VMQEHENLCRSLVGEQVGESRREDYLFYCEGYPLSFSAGSLNRAESRALRRSCLRNPVPAVLNETEYLFTHAEWEQAEELGQKLSRSINRIRMEDIEGKVKLCSRLACQRTRRLILAAAKPTEERTQ
jgi:hypothetical protein